MYDLTGATKFFFLFVEININVATTKNAVDKIFGAPPMKFQPPNICVESRAKIWFDSKFSGLDFWTIVKRKKWHC